MTLSIGSDQNMLAIKPPKALASTTTTTVTMAEDHVESDGQGAAETESNSGTSHAELPQHQILEIENRAAEQQANQYGDRWRYSKFMLAMVEVSLSSFGIIFQAKGSLLPIEVGDWFATLHSGALLGVAYRMLRQVSSGSVMYILAMQSSTSTGLAPNGSGMLSSFGAAEDGTFASVRSLVGEALANY